MNQTQHYMDFNGGHMSSMQQQHQPLTATSSAMSMYNAPQPTLLQPGPGTYSPAQTNYGSYGYNTGVSSPQSVTHTVSSSLVGPPVPVQSQVPSLPTTSAPSSAIGQDSRYPGANFDTTGQIQPPGMKPRVTATLWEDEGSLCFQVEARGVCVARREDNHMINGTKLLNVAGMTRGRRDGILKSEKQRHVVKIGPMHLKGVWIPFERALDFANKEKITELLYPLFVHHISQLLYHPTNQNRTNAVMQAAQARRNEQNLVRSQQLAPPLPNNLALAPPPATSVAPSMQSSARPVIDRAHTFPTPPTSTTNTQFNINSQDNGYHQWGNQTMINGHQQQPQQPLVIDTGLSNTRSLPSTPATTPPGNNVQSSMQYGQNQGYDSRIYSAPPQQQSQYAPHHDMNRYAPSMPQNHYIKSDMAPPVRSDSHVDHAVDSKNVLASQHPGAEHHISHVSAEEEADHEAVHEDDYGHQANNAYHPRGAYSYPSVGTMHGDHAQLSPELTDSPNQAQHQHQPGSAKATPHSSQHWVPQSGYHTPPRMASSNGSIGKDYGPNGVATDAYGHGMGVPNGYAPGPAPGHQQQGLSNGSIGGSAKRRRDDDDDGTDGGHLDEDGLKRRKTIHEGSASASLVPGGLNRSRSVIVRRR
jgi:protein SOK2